MKPKRGHSCLTVGLDCQWRPLSRSNPYLVTLTQGMQGRIFQCARCGYVTCEGLQQPGWKP